MQLFRVTRDVGILRSHDSSDDGTMQLLSKSQLEAKTKSAGEERRTSVWEERGEDWAREEVR